MSPADLGKLREQRRALAAELHAGLLEQADLSRIQGLRARLDLLDPVIAAETPRPNRVRRYAIALMLTLGVIPLLMLFKLPTVSFSMEVIASAAQMHLVKPLVLEPSAKALAGQIRVVGFDRFDSGSGALNAAYLRRTDPDLMVHSAGLFIAPVTFAKDMPLELMGGPGGSAVVIKGRANTFEAQVTGKSQVRFAGGDSIDDQIGVSERILTSWKEREAEIYLYRKPGESFDWGELKVSTLSFLTRRKGADSTSERVSSIIGGTIRLPDVKNSAMQLGGGQAVDIEGLEDARLTATQGDHLSIKVEGKAKRLVVFDGLNQRNLETSIFDYLLNSPYVSALWSAAAFLWAAILWFQKNVVEEL